MNTNLALLLHSLFRSLLEFNTGIFLFKWGIARGEHKWKVKRILLFTLIGVIWDNLHFKVSVRLWFFALREVFLRFVVVKSRVSFALNHDLIVGVLLHLFAFDFNFFWAAIFLHFDVIAAQRLLWRLLDFAVLKLFHPLRSGVGGPFFFLLGPEEEALTSSRLVSTGDGGIYQRLQGTSFRNWGPNQVREAQDPVRGDCLLNWGPFKGF